MLEDRDATERVTLPVLLWNAGLSEYVYLDQTVFDQVTDEARFADPGHVA